MLAVLIVFITPAGYGELNVAFLPFHFRKKATFAALCRSQTAALFLIKDLRLLWMSFYPNPL